MNAAARPLVPLGDFMLAKGGSIDPSKRPDDRFVLYSIPSFDAGNPETVSGHEIGSPKKKVECGDVLLSRIVPHIRRGWIVGSHPNTEILASGEWIVFRSNKIHAPYLRHFLVSDVFHPQFMKTVAGVGGSLLRAKPNYVADITIPLPRLDEQRRIAAILDKADALRRKRKQVIGLLDGLVQARFFQVFGARRDPIRELREVVKSGTIVTYGIVQAGPEWPSGVPYIRTGDLVDGQIQIETLRHTDPAIAARFSRSRVEAGEIVMSIRATVGTTAIVPPELEGANLTQGTARIAPGSRVTQGYLLEYLRSKKIQQWIAAQVKGATFLEITLGRLRQLPVAVPPIDLQDKFSAMTETVIRRRAAYVRGLELANTLFRSLQGRAFSSQL